MSSVAEENVKKAEILSELTGLKFQVMDGAVVCSRGTTEGFHRLTYLCDNYGRQLRVLVTGGNGITEVESADLELLEKLHAREPKRRDQAQQVSDMLKAITGLDWQWNGHYHHAPYNVTHGQIPRAIYNLEREGVIVGESGFQVRMDEKEELEIHGVDFTKLQAKYEALKRTPS